MIAGIIGFIVTFITTMERHSNWKSKADVDKSTALVYTKLESDIDTQQLRLSAREKGLNGQELVTSFKEKLENIEELSGNHLIPREIRMVYEHVFGQIRLKYRLVDIDEGVGPAVLAMINHKITSHWYWPFFLPSDTEKLAGEILDGLKDELAKREEAREKERGEKNA